MLQLEKLAKDHYKPNPELMAAINTALFLERPLLLSGEPGTGKTQCADFIARQLHHSFPKKFKAATALRFNTKSVSQSTDLFYQYDAVGHFGDKKNKPKESFIHFNEMGTALLATKAANKDWNVFRNYTTDVLPNVGFGSVLLIDEIDKAPRDFPNDLLAELEKPPFKFAIKELDGFQVVQDTTKPIVVIITSNSEKGLPDAFLRRCVFHHINFPDDTMLFNIVETALESKNPVYSDAITLFMELRNNKSISKPPATSELIDWVSCLQHKELLNDNLRKWQDADSSYRKKIIDTLGVITKNKSDFESLKKEIDRK
ncbi:AAA family ATPase [Flagellimonas algicola]|uniref:MoxR family ATPase n=1 Tax=Flagellimonas algicola TaxID=2583815 RepID=A0ABY2WSG2_9FLAO|nr:MoxR family ATPase [Allomuricauda algicola]TMU57459.1 MoxR family ATPase [Allomuricauda algicola]